jgi:hypothetical protein
MKKFIVSESLFMSHTVRDQDKLSFSIKFYDMSKELNYWFMKHIVVWEFSMKKI